MIVQDVGIPYLQHKKVTERKWCKCIRSDKTAWPLVEIASQSANDDLADNLKMV